MSDESTGREDRLERTERSATEIADQARESSERTAARASQGEHAGDGSSGDEAIERADAIRDASNARTDARQEQLAEGNREAASELRHGASGLDVSEAARAHQSVAANRDTVDGIAERARALRDDTRRLREQLRRRRTDVEGQS